MPRFPKRAKRTGIGFALGSILFIFLFPVFVFAETEGQIKTFFVDENYDLQSREQISAGLKRVSQNGYFYIEENWYQNLAEKEKETINQNLEKLSQDFDKIIYPQLISFFGQEWKPGIDSDGRITILFHQIKEKAAGYFNNGDEYPKIQNPKSNEREMVYLSTESLLTATAKSYLAHEFVHLITFNQKERLRGVVEEIWLNEMRADYTPSLLGYDNEYQNSNLQQRVRSFLGNPSDPLTEWQSQKEDYGIVNLFAQYLVEHYGKEILADSLKSEKIGISSLNYALKKNNKVKGFQQIFTDWTIAIFLNNCSLGKDYCYQNENLKNLRVIPSLIFLPSTNITNVFLNYSAKQWAGNWYRVMGGEGELKIEFKAAKNVLFKIPYVLCRENQDCQIAYLGLDKNQTGKIAIEDFGKSYTSLTLIPSILSKETGFSDKEPLFNFSISISVEDLKQKEKIIEELKAQIEDLKTKIAVLKAKIVEDLRVKMDCHAFKNNLYFGLFSPEVNCLQQFLKTQGPDIYPEARITGFLGPLTQTAIIRFQEKYADEILLPLKMEKGTGFVGLFTRSKINQILQK
ncbi:hypothetical protein KKF17_00205 [Patescibacteria group bacterium]|nr:hypothetical protein [Patescibacteria group bacterium]